MFDLEQTKSIDRYKYFRDVQLWPLTNEFNFQGWLKNFESNIQDYELACHIMDFFNYFPKNIVDQMLISSVGRAGYELSRFFLDWKHSDFKKRCIYSFIPGEIQNPSDSGNLFMRKLRDVLEIEEDRFIDFSVIHDFLESSKVPIPVVFVDDFVGSGMQCYTAWCLTEGGRHNKTLSNISLKSGHKFVYAPLIVNKKGYDFIKMNCNDLILSPSHIIGPQYNLFDPSCICWKGDLALYKSGIELILRKSNELGIPSTNGTHVNDEKGFHEQGLALAFEHGVPDAVPAFFYWNADGWTPLIKKTYKR